MPRRAKGDGSVSKKKRADGRVPAYLTVGTRPDGKPDRRWVYGRTKTEAAEKLRALQAQLAEGALPDPNRMTVEQLLKLWLEGAALRDKITTLAKYKYRVEKYILPTLGRVPLKKVTALDVQRLQNTLASTPTTAFQVRALLHQALEQALAWKLIGRNPCDGVRPPKPVRRDMRILEPAEIRQLLAATESHWLRAVVRLALATGMRQGEILGLRWSDLAGGVVTVRQISTQGEKGRRHIGTPKTPAAVRRVPVDPVTLVDLARQRDRVRGLKLAAGDAWQERDLVFPTRGGLSVTAGNFQRSWDLVRSPLGLKDCRFHDLRHTHSSLCIASGMEVRTLSARLGHRNPSTTLNTYSHLFEAQRDRPALPLAALLESLEGPQVVRKVVEGVEPGSSAN